MNILDDFGADYIERTERAIQAVRNGGGFLLVDDENRENEGDMIFSAETMTPQQMALMIRECSGIVCLCLEKAITRKLGLRQMVTDNESRYGTAFTVSIEARNGVTTGVSAADRITTIRAAVAENAQPRDLASPGHVFPLEAREGGVLERRGHTEGSVDMMALAGLRKAAVLCELTNEDGTMAKLPNVAAFAIQYSMPLLSIDDICRYKLLKSKEISKNDREQLAG